MHQVAMGGFGALPALHPLMMMPCSTLQLRHATILQQRLPQLFRDFDSLVETVEALKKASAP